GGAGERGSEAGDRGGGAHCDAEIGTRPVDRRSRCRRLVGCGGVGTAELVAEAGAYGVQRRRLRDAVAERARAELAVAIFELGRPQAPQPGLEAAADRPAVEEIIARDGREGAAGGGIAGGMEVLPGIAARQVEQ